MAGAKFYYQGRSSRRVTDMTEAQAIEKLSADPTARSLTHRHTHEEAIEAIEAADLAIAENDNAMANLEMSYTGWSRFFLVTSSIGHIHSSMHCSTCRPTTTYGWLPNLSGQTEADAVEQCGPALCTVCFPTAPTANTMAKLTAKQAADILAGKKVTAEPAKVYCPGSGERSTTKINWRLYSPSGSCPHCKHVGGVTQDGRMRKHKEKS